MRLKRLEMQGFKSFAQKTEVIFNEGITGIVGPNGSGKSNIGDAIRWVLGETSAKSLRGASMSDVIFNGTEKRAPRSYCEVSLVFEKTDDEADAGMPSSEVMVTRRVYRTGEGEYFINGASCRLKDIVDMFRDTGIGRDGYSIIGQGRIDEILSRKGEDRREVFEEAAGIATYRVRKEEAERRLANTLDNAARIDDILTELERQLGPLEEQSRSARAYLEYAEELKGLDMNLFLIRSDRYTAKLAELQVTMDALDTVLKDTEAAIAEKTELQNGVQERIADLEEKLTGARDALMTCVENVHASEKQLAGLKSRREERAANRGHIAADQAENNRKLAELEEMFVSSHAESLEQDTRVEQAEKTLEDARADMERREQTETDAEAALEAHKAAIIRLMNRASAVQNDKTRLTTMKESMEKRLEEVSCDADGLKTKETELSEACAAAAKRLADEQALLKEKEQALIRLNREYEAAELQLRASREKYDALNTQVQTSQSRVKLLGELTRSMEGYNQSVRQAIQYAHDRGIPGVYGTVTQLITVPKKIETAIDMALGAAQQNIVTDTEETAKELIRYLRENRLGRATFLPLSAVRSTSLNGQERRALMMKGSVGVASELVECDAKFRPIVENLLGRTVIAEDLDAGIAMTRACGHSFRLVTLVGDVMHAGGSMTGGSTQSRAVSLLGRERELKETEQQVKEGIARLTELKARNEEMSRSLTECREKGTAALNEVHQQEIAVAREQEHSDTAVSDLSAHRDHMQATGEAENQLREAIADIERQLGEIGLQTEKEESREDMDAKTDELQQALNEARALASSARDNVTVRTLQLNDLKHELETLKRDHSRFEEELEAARKEKERREALLKEMDDQEAQDALEAADADAQAETRRLEQTRQEAIIASLEEKRTAEQERLKETLTQIDSLHQAYNRDSDRRHREELNRSRTESDLKQLQDRMWNTYEVTYAGAEEFRQTEGFDAVAADRRAAQLSTQIRALGAVNTNAVEEYDATKKRYDELKVQQDDIRKAEQDLRTEIEEVLGKMKTTFVGEFSKMQGYFSETFTRLFGGGKAELTLVDPSDPLNCGIEINAQPPGKKLQLLTLLSGGERALTAIAILFAMLKLKATPFCVLDEIEAALDDANIAYYADYLKEYSEKTQFIVITHRKGTMERCNSLYGVSMEEQGVSKMVSVQLKDYQDYKEEVKA